MKNRQVEYDLMVITISLKLPFEHLEELFDNSPPLIQAIQKLKRDLKKRDVEVFLEKENILVTEEGYKVMLFEQSLLSGTGNPEELDFIRKKLEENRNKPLMWDNEDNDPLDFLDDEDDDEE